MTANMEDNDDESNTAISNCRNLTVCKRDSAFLIFTSSEDTRTEDTHTTCIASN